MFWIFSDDFRPVPIGKHRKLTGIHRKKSGQCPAGILLPCSSDFQYFPAGSADFTASFLQDPVGYGGRNHRPGYQCAGYWREHSESMMILMVMIGVRFMNEEI